MQQQLTLVTFLVREYEESIAFFTKTLRFTLVEDTLLGEGKRWIRVAPPSSETCCLLLARATTSEQLEHVGHQGGGRVFLFLQTDDFHRDYTDLRSRGLRFLEAPRTEPYGT